MNLTPSEDAPFVPSDRMVSWGCETIRNAFDAYLREFDEITRRAKARFEARDWRGRQRDALVRLTLVSDHTWRTMLVLRTQFGERLKERALWMRMKPCYAQKVASHAAVEQAQTFFNSVTRRVFATVGVDPQIEFVSPVHPPPPSSSEGDADEVVARFERRGDTRALLRDILSAYPFDARWRSLEEDVTQAAQRVDALGPPDEVELARSVFYRGKGAYLVGRARRDGTWSAFILALLHGEDGVFVDAVLQDDRQARVLFSFTRSYFHVEAPHPAWLVAHLQKVLPIRRRSELYISIGFTKHGKTELYRELLEHVHRTQERFEPAAGDRGMVMIVFTLPSLDLVFKVIRDKISPPKNTSHDEVKQKYGLVYRQDRAGRLVDAQEFEHLSFDVARFDERVLEELLQDAPEVVRVEDGKVHIRHLYVERRVRPLNLYLREADPARAEAAILDYGKAIRDLAATNTFPGDLLLKNFGVTRNGRVIFYDYDELALVTDCRFRDLPTPRDDEEETSGEPWFFVDEDDIFPEEFLRFLGLTPEQERAFLAAHGELLTAAFWRKIQERVRSGEVVDIFPYPKEARLRPDA